MREKKKDRKQIIETSKNINTNPPKQTLKLVVESCTKKSR